MDKQFSKFIQWQGPDFNVFYLTAKPTLSRKMPLSCDSDIILEKANVYPLGSTFSPTFPTTGSQFSLPHQRSDTTVRHPLLFFYTV